MFSEALHSTLCMHANLANLRKPGICNRFTYEFANVRTNIFVPCQSQMARSTTSKAALTISQLLVFNSVKHVRTSGPSKSVITASSDRMSLWIHSHAWRVFLSRRVYAAWKVFPTPRRSRTPLIFRVLPACVA